jgi:hypothetical protein
MRLCWRRSISFDPYGALFLGDFAWLRNNSTEAAYHPAPEHIDV